MPDIQFSYSDFLQWALAHAKDIPALVSHLTNVVSADLYSPKWEAFKPAGDIVASALDNLPTTSASTAMDDSEVEAELLADLNAPKEGDDEAGTQEAWTAGRLRDLYSLILLVRQIMELLRGLSSS